MNVGDSVAFNYIGSDEEHIITRRGIYCLEVWGSAGTVGFGRGRGGYGGYTKGWIELNRGDILSIRCGGQPYNGGNLRGGGATDIRLNGNGINDRIIVAGGGGGGGMTDQGASSGGDGGGLVSTSVSTKTGAGGTQTTGHSLGYGDYNSGGGYYGGKRAVEYTVYGGGGGSGYYDKLIDNSIRETKSTTHNTVGKAIIYFITRLPEVSYLIKSSNTIKTFANNTWVDTELIEPLSKNDFEIHGINNLSIIPYEKWMELDNEFEIITWTDIPPKVIEDSIQGEQKQWSEEGKLFEISIDRDIKTISDLILE